MVAEHPSKLDQIRALREARVAAAENGAAASEIHEKRDAKSPEKLAKNK